MKEKICLILICFLILTNISNSPVYGSYLNIEYIDVKLTKPIKTSNMITLESNSGFSIYNKEDKLMEIAKLPDSVINVTPNETGDINILDVQNNIVYILPRDGSMILGSGSMENHFLKVGKDRYRDYIRFLSNGNELTIINHVKLDHYLYGVVPSEMPSSFPIEALKAQAIAARNYALRNVNKHIKEGYNLCDTVHCQVYSGLDWEKDSTNKAIDETKDMYIYYNGELIDAVYHSTSGGYTEDSNQVWGNDFPYLKPVEDIYSKDSPNSSWTLQISSSELNKRLVSAGVNVGEVLDMEVLETTSAGRVQKLKVKGTLGEQVLGSSKIRAVLGSADLKSTWFSVRKEGHSGENNTAYVLDGNNEKADKINLNNAHIIDGQNKQTASRGIISRVINRDNTETLGGLYNHTDQYYIIEGKGYGHGVGMSQWGAKKMAEEGYSYEEILKHYYSGVDILYNGW